MYVDGGEVGNTIRMHKDVMKGVYERRRYVSSAAHYAAEYIH